MDIYHLLDIGVGKILVNNLGKRSQKISLRELVRATKNKYIKFIEDLRNNQYFFKQNIRIGIIRILKSKFNRIPQLIKRLRKILCSLTI